MEKSLHAPDSPFLAQVAQPRTEGSEMPGHYSKELDMWVLETDHGIKPIIDEGVLAQLATKTKVQQEEDDDSPYALQLMTKTEQQLEGDDESHFATSQALQLLTKSNQVQEGDDNFIKSSLLELMTKTAINQEGDDESFL
ncbi:hypothetical protein [Pseudomonas sp. TE3786]